MTTGIESKIVGRKCLVAGGAGFIGSHLVEHLLQIGASVTVLDDFSTGKKENLSFAAKNEQLKVIEKSILDHIALSHLVKDFEFVFNLATLGVRHSIKNPVANHQVNALGSLNLIESARYSNKLVRYIHVSSSEVYGTARQSSIGEGHPTFPHTVYGASKLAGEAYARAYNITYGLPVTVIRPFNIFGPRSHFESDAGEVIPKSILRALTGNPILVFGDGSQERDFTFVTDAVKAIVTISTRPSLIGTTINIGSGKAISIKSLAEIILELTPGTNKGIEFCEPRPGDLQCLLCNCDFARQQISYSPDISLRQGLEKVILWFKDNKNLWSNWMGLEAGKNWL